MTIDISDNNPRVEYAVAAGVTQTTFAVPFDFFEDSDVSVYVDGVLKTLGSNYTLTGGNGSTGSITSLSVTGIVGGSTVSVTRHTSLERTTDFPTGQEINRASLNEQLDTIVAQVADLDAKVDRTVHLNDYEVAPSMLLTGDRKGKTLAFNVTKQYKPFPFMLCGKPTTAASATFVWATKALSISAVPRLWPDTIITSSTLPVIQ